MYGISGICIAYEDISYGIMGIYNIDIYKGFSMGISMEICMGYVYIYIYGIYMWNNMGFMIWDIYIYEFYGIYLWNTLW